MRTSEHAPWVYRKIYEKQADSNLVGTNDEFGEELV